MQNLQTTIPTDAKGYAVAPLDSYLDALMTKPRSVIGLPAYGTLFPTRKHRTVNLVDIRRDFKDACAFDDRLTFLDVAFDVTQLEMGAIKFDVTLNLGTITGELVT